MTGVKGMVQPPRDLSRVCGFPTRSTGMGCQIYPAPGRERCAIHGGPRQREEARIEKVLNMVKDMKFGERFDVTPEEALLDLVQYKSAEVSYWRIRVAGLEEIVGMRVVEEGSSESEGMGQFGETSDNTQTVKSQEVVHPWYKLLRDCERDLATYARAAMQGGVEERQVRVAEAVGIQMLGMLNDLTRALNLNPAQQAIAASTIPTLLRALPAPSRARQV